MVWPMCPQKQVMVRWVWDIISFVESYVGKMDLCGVMLHTGVLPEIKLNNTKKEDS